MRYTWRILITLTSMVINGIIIYNVLTISVITILAYFLNSAIGWIIGHQIDKYRLSKRDLGTTKTALLDYSYALDSVAVAIGITNEVGQFEFVNKAHIKLYGYSKEEFLTFNWNHCYSKETLNYLNNTATPDFLKDHFWKGEVVGVRKDGTTFSQEISLSYMKESQKTICIVRNITEQISFEKFMKHAAEHNDLTNLPNRRRLLADLAKSCKGEIQDTSLFFIDLDRFKMINDTLGHEIGDELLKNVAKRLLSFQSEFVNVYHHSGDEFIVLIQNKNITYIKLLAMEIVTGMKKPFFINGNEIFITTSIGISRYPDHTNTINDIIKMADTAMYQAKLSGKNTFKFFTNELKLQLARKAVIESQLRRAIKNEELFILYQPKFKLTNNEIVGIEALIRWQHPFLGLVSPVEFIPIAEETGLIIDIGKWVIQEVLHQMSNWQDQGYPLVKVSVNVSQRQFRDKELVPTIGSNLHTFTIDAKYFEIEITESVIEDIELVIPKLNMLKEMGVGISIDDFGTGYSSLNILKDLPIDTLKVDQTFIRDLVGSSRNHLLVKTILEIGKILDLKVVAEGIETEEQLNQLLKLNCPIGQGYYFSKPIRHTELENKFFKKSIYT
ncbi:MAG: EAL domain-containing protein [Bacillus sp. (in: Bacteria)]|nr:EAL domain-containing protein [Bacillus sp. (in: firmicutes)]